MTIKVRLFPGLTSVCLLLVLFTACKSASEGTATTNSNTAEAQPPSAASAPAAEAPDPELIERMKTEKWKGDLSGMVERRYIRALVFYNKTNFFYDGPQARGITYDAMMEFEKFLNQKLNTGTNPVHIVFLPVSRSEAMQRIQDGRADIVAGGLAILPEVKAIADFSDPIRSGASEIVVTGASGPALSTVDDLSGKEVYVRKVSRYWLSLNRLNERLKAEGKPPVILKEADDNLEDEDILDMVNAGLVGITVMDDLVASFWAKVYDGLKVHPEITVAAGEDIGWAVAKDTPEFLSLVNEFVRDHKLGTTFGNILLQKYLKDTKWAKNNTAPSEMQKFSSAIEFFKKYAGQYNFDWLMIAAQAYQESQIDQSRRSSAGAVGVMQIKPSTAEGNPINITGVESNAERNIQAGVKYLNFIMDEYFKGEPIDRVNRGLFAFASYNAGPAKISRLRKQAAAEGLDPNRWFNNVELVAAKEIGKETVTYVSNIYKYYIAYKLVSEGNARKRAAKPAA
jgi:membrane-bound lytic murein transglycosylase MltF